MPEALHQPLPLLLDLGRLVPARRCCSRPLRAQFLPALLANNMHCVLHLRTFNSRSREAWRAMPRVRLEAHVAPDEGEGRGGEGGVLLVHWRHLSTPLHKTKK